MKPSWRWMALTLLCGCLAAALALVPRVRAAEDDEDRLEPEQAATQGAAAKQEMADRLANFGRKYNDPSALVSAGILLLQVPKARALTANPKTAGEGADGAKTEELEDPRQQAEALFKDALKMADPAAAAEVKAMIASAMKNVPVPVPGGKKGPIGGPKTKRRILPKGVVDTYEFEFVPQEAAYISVRGDRKLHIEVIRPSGEHVCDVNFGSASVNFTPRNRQKWTVKISNISNGPNSYTLTVN